ncbi:MAG: hypothetical protein IJS01_12620 [Lentisphaeria bacterium]|nr:hypothetical protein [Lentisphaeria bacterium]
MKFHLILLVGAFLAGGASAETKYTGWRLTPDAEKKLAEYSAASTGCRLKNNRTEFVTRAQLKYTLSKDDYLHRWYDRPLYQNSGLAHARKKNMKVSDAEAQALKTALERGKISGIASLLHTSGRTSFFKTSLDNHLRLHGELGARRSAAAINRAYLPIAGMMLAGPNVFRFNGKPLISFYPAAVDVSYIKDIREAFQAKFGNKFNLVPYVPFYDKHKFSRAGDPLKAADIDAMAEALRSQLRISDGILISGTHFLRSGGRTDTAFGFKVMIPILHKIFSEPEFKDKFLAYGLIQGHENQYRWNFTRDSEGVATLRRELEFVAALRPDVCLLTEWDEVNENTCYRPMVNTGWSSLRMVRYFSEKIRGEKITSFPGDDLSVPNLIFSYRRRLLAGETAEYQVSNIPDQTPAREYRITLILTDAKGNVVRRFAPRSLKSTECAETTFTAPAAELLKYQLVKPRLEITWKGGRYTPPDSFWAQELRADWNQDWQWAKHPLREQLCGIRADYTITPYENGLLRLKGKITGPVPLAQAEILDGSDTVWMADNRPGLRETDDDAVIRIEFHGLARFDFKASFDLRRAPGARTGSGRKLPWTFKENKWNSNFSRSFYLRLPKKEIDEAVLDIRVPGIFNENIPVREIMKKQIVGYYAGKHGLHMVLSRYNSQYRIPEHVNRKEVSFDFFVLPADPKKSVFSARCIDQKGNTWRGAEKSLYTPSGKTRIFTVYDKSAGRVVKVSADENLLTPMIFDFTPGRGTVVPNSSGRKYYAVMNGCTPLASGIGFGGSRYGSLMFDALLKGGEYPELPRRIPEDGGTWSMEFDKRSHLSLPMQVVPMYAGYKVSMKILVPELSTHEQFIFGSGSHGFMLSVSNGRLRAQMFLGVRFDATGSGLVYAESAGKLIPGKWNDVSVLFDQKTFTVYLNGEPGEPVGVTGNQMRPKAGILGGGEDLKSCFTGKIKDLSINVF